MDDATRALLRATVVERATRLRVPGAQVAVRRDGELLWSACVGGLRAGANAREVVRPEDRFVIASATKLVIACTVLSLVEHGELDLDAPVGRWLPELPDGDRITVRMLLGHRSGLPEYFRDRAVRRKLADPRAEWTRAELLAAAGRLGSEAKPDERFAYRNTNYIALGELMARATGRSVGELVEERVGRPLRLATLSFDHDPEHGRVATPHARRFRRPVDLLSRTRGRLPSHTVGEVWTDGGLATSAEDLATLTEALFAGRLLRDDTVEAMTRRFVSAGAGPGGVLGLLQTVFLGRVRRAYGLGVAVDERAASTSLGHEGMYYGWSATTTFDPSTRTAVAVLTNLAAIPVPAERLERALRGVLADSRAFR